MPIRARAADDHQRHRIVLDAPSNLGLRPPELGAVPGCYKLPWALRNHGLVQVLAAEDAGSVVPPRYRAHWKPGEGDRNAESIATYSIALADRMDTLLSLSGQVVVLGGECSILIGTALSLKRRGRFGLVYLDAHSDFRHPGNSEAIGAAGGEALAIVTGRGDARLTDLDGAGPYVRHSDIHVVGVRDDDDHLDELATLGIRTTTSSQVREGGIDATADEVLGSVTRSADGFWIHLDLDVVDSSQMTAVDCPEPNGLMFKELSRLLGYLVRSPRCAGLELTIYDPDLDPSGETAEAIVACMGAAVGTRALE